MIKRQYGRFSVAAADLLPRSYACDPALCRGNVCCGKFAIALTVAEKERLAQNRRALAAYCPALANDSAMFQETPCEIFLAKTAAGLCVLNYLDEAGRAWCAAHSLALARGENPYAFKPLNCAVWPFLRDGADCLRVDPAVAPCLSENNSGQPAAGLLALLEELAKL